VDGAVYSNIKEDSESKKDYTNCITQPKYIVSLTSKIINEKSNKIYKCFTRM
jgi:hypothetical protein